MNKSESPSIIKPYQLGNTVAKVVEELKRIVKSGRTIVVDGCGYVKNIDDIVSIVDCIEKSVLSYRLEKWRRSINNDKQIGRPKGSVLDLYKDEIFALLSKGMRLNDVCDIFGVKASRVSKWLKRNGISLKEIRENEK